MKLFNKIAVKRPKYSKFDLSHEVKMSANFGKLIPINCMEIIPGDNFRVNTEMLIRLAPMKFPVMHRMNAYIHHWFVPARLIHNEWEDLITGGDDGLSAPVHPYIDLGQIANAANALLQEGTLWDYMGMPPMEAATVNQRINSLPFRAYQLIYNEFYRDQNLINKVTINKNSGAETVQSATDLLTLRYRAWEHDYFTSCLPEAQKGGEVLLPMQADVVYKEPGIFSNNGTPVANGALVIGTDANGNIVNKSSFTDPSPGQGIIDNIESIENATTTINDLRKASRLQEWLEKSMRGGSRYAEHIRSFFGKRTSDARLQRPEYLGGSSQPIVISEVLQTYEGTDPLGKMGGHGISVGKSNHFRREFEEHGYLISLLSLMPKSAYSQGIPKMFQKSDRFDYAWPEFAQIGEQAVLNKEVYFDWTDGTNAWNDMTFGYIPRYSELKFINSRIAGQFRTTMANWHMARKFENRPALNEQFISSQDASQDIFNVVDPDEDKFFIQLYHSISAIRALPYFGTPTL